VLELPSLERSGDPAPHARFLSNGRWTALATGAGTGYSAFRNLALTRVDADRTEDPCGVFLYLRDLESGAFVSVGAQPCRAPAPGYAARYAPGVLEIAREDETGLRASLELCVHPERDLELRRLRLRSDGTRVRRIEVSAVLEVALQHRLAHEAHPAFSKLFVETAFDPDAEALLARRRPRSRGESTPWLAACFAGPGALAFETDRARWLGRGRSAARPRGLESGAPLSGSLGSVLDPVFVLRRCVELAPGEEQELALLLAAADTREAACALAGEGSGPEALETVFAWASLAERARLGRLGLDEARAAALQELAGAMLYGHPGIRAGADTLARARGPLRRLDRLGVRRDAALALVPPECEGDAGLAREVEQAEAYWRALGLPLEVWSLRPSELAPEDQDLLLAFASLVFDAPLETLVARLSPARPAVRGKPARGPSRKRRAPRVAPLAAPAVPDPRLPATRFGFFSDAGEFVVRLGGGAPAGGERPPMPWVNVVANERAGFLASESGAGYTWARNSRENKLTPWSNDPVSDPHGEALYLRELASGACWSPQPGPAPADAPYEVRHGFGYTTWRHESHEIDQEVTAFVPRADPLRIVRVRLEERSGRARELSLVSYARLVLGALVSESARFVCSEWDGAGGVLFARGVGDERGDEVTFAAAVAPAGATLHGSGDRTSFLGRAGSPERPAALAGDEPLDGRAGPGLDACAALEVRLALAAHGRSECAFLLGEAASEAEARALVARYREASAVGDALEEACGFWSELRGTLRVETPSPALDAMANGWLLYQTLSCRIFARSAFYQSGGAFGFRDQLQDAAALTLLQPELARAQLLLHAAHQFPEGDVLHWWHTPSGRGPRTRFSDDLLWLPFLASYYARTTGDAAVFDERAPFVAARLLAPGEDEAFLQPEASEESDTLYGHCCRAIERSLEVGAHGLPLMGTGDWNDGMNRVGREGRGESVWLGFFLHRILGELAPVAEARGEPERAQRWHEHRARLGAALEEAWDGDWYRRAYTDDGTPLGSASGEECRIDVLPQAWAVLTGAVSAERAAHAMRSAEAHLVDLEAGLVRLLTPPFDRTPLDPGYIKGYVPGIRENGGQYTHGAMWLIAAMAELGWRERAAPLLERLTPVWHSRDDAAVAGYEVEPYVVAADVYGAPPHVGRGGWTWYTGSAGWMLRVLVESILGLTLEGGSRLRLRPCVPDAWPGFRVRWREVEIEVRNPGGCSEGVVSCLVDGVPAPLEAGAARIALRAGGGRQRVVAELGRLPRPAG
jgi:cyclic beta-1,2-glucan synthetase